MASLSSAFINFPPIFNGTDFSLWKCRIKSYVESIDFDLWDIIIDGPFIPTWIKNNGSTVIKPKEKLNQDEKERVKKNAMALYILQCSLHNDIFNHVCCCETANELWKKLLLMYKDNNEENLILSKMEKMLDDCNGKKEANDLCLMTSEQVGNPNSSDDDCNGPNLILFRILFLIILKYIYTNIWKKKRF